MKGGSMVRKVDLIESRTLRFSFLGRSMQQIGPRRFITIQAEIPGSSKGLRPLAQMADLIRLTHNEFPPYVYQKYSESLLDLDEYARNL